MALGHRENAVAVTRRINAPAARIFTFLCDPAGHVAIDGSGMLQSSSTAPVAGVGESFTVEMRNRRMGDYEMTNVIIDFEPERVIRWQPMLTRASRAEDRDRIGNPAKHRWGFELTPVSDSVTDVTQTFDCIESPEWLKSDVKGGQLWVESMTATLDKLAAWADGDPLQRAG